MVFSYTNTTGCTHVRILSLEQLYVQILARLLRRQRAAAAGRTQVHVVHCGSG